VFCFGKSFSTEVFNMGLLGDFFTGVANGVLKSSPRTVQSNPGVRQVEAICAQNGWGIDERMGDDGIVLNFKDKVVGTRQLLVTVASSGNIALFSVFSAASFAPRDLPADLGYFLLLRNKELLFSSWKLTKNDNDTVGFSASYCALLNSLTATTFKVICETLLKEVYEVDLGLQSKGYI
jgi:hypothetical protein